MKKKRKLRSVPLRSSFDCRRYLARLVNEVRRGEIQAFEATRIGFLINILLKCIEQSDIAGRLEVLERNAGVMVEQRKVIVGDFKQSTTN